MTALTEDKIESVKIVSNDETQGISAWRWSPCPKAIVAAQSTQVDIVGNATVSGAILEAVNDALTKAGVDPASLVPVKAEAPAGRRTRA